VLFLLKDGTVKMALAAGPAWVTQLPMRVRAINLQTFDTASKSVWPVNQPLLMFLFRLIFFIIKVKWTEHPPTKKNFWDWLGSFKSY